MDIDTDKMVRILKADQPLSVIMVEDHGKDKLLCLFALPELADKIKDFAKTLINQPPTTV